jgi:hypothetical protein
MGRARGTLRRRVENKEQEKELKEGRKGVKELMK